MAVGIGVHGQDDDVAEHAQRLRVGSADQLIHLLDQLLGAEHLIRVQPAVDPHDRLAFPRQVSRLVVGGHLGKREAARDALVVVEPCQVLGRGDHRHPLAAPLLRAADVHEPHPLGLAVERLPVRLELRVGGEKVVVPDRRAKGLCRRRNRGLDLRLRQRPRGRERREHHDRQDHLRLRQHRSRWSAAIIPSARRRPRTAPPPPAPPGNRRAC